MARTKSRARPFVANTKRVANPDITVYDCPLSCGAKQTVECTIDMKEMEGRAVCSTCLECFTMKITTSTKPIDIFTEWRNECFTNVTYNSDSENK